MRIPLSIKISLGVIFVVIIQISLIIYNAYVYLVEEEIEETRSELHFNISRLQQTVEFLVQIKEFEQVQAELSSIGSSKRLINAFIIDENNNVIASSKLSQVGYEARHIVALEDDNNLKNVFIESRKNLKSKILMSQNNTELISSYPIVLGLKKGTGVLENRIGIIYSNVDLTWVDAKVKGALRNKILPLILMLGVMTVLFALFLNRFITTRIANIHQAATQFPMSGYKSRALVSGKD